jgi:hypothetical protein
VRDRYHYDKVKKWQSFDYETITRIWIDNWEIVQINERNYIAWIRKATEEEIEKYFN